MWLAGALIAALVIAAPAPRAAGERTGQVDHLVYATPDLTLGIETAESCLACAPLPVDSIRVKAHATRSSRLVRTRTSKSSDRIRISRNPNVDAVSGSTRS